MRSPIYILSLIVLFLGIEPATAADAPSWKKTVVDQSFRSEGVAVADVNKDGKNDILVGDLWYEGPSWVKKHEIRRVGKFGDGSRGYSQSFACWADDINKDSWPDLIVIGFPGAPCHWYENPQNKPGHWKAHVIWKSACNETPQYLDLLGDGKRKLIMGIQPEGQMCWFEPGKDPTQLWTKHAISVAGGKKVPGTHRFSHGLGVGDLNGDGKLDVMCTGGWWQQPDSLTGKPWQFHKAKIGDACADMYAYDVDGDKKADVISSSAHRIGIWRHLQKTPSSFLTQTMFKDLFSQSHAMHCTDINGDGLRDLVTGKRWWAHGPKGDINPNDPAVLYWFEAKKSSDGTVTFTPHKIDVSSGIGTQFFVGDINGDKKPDVVISNKKGVFVLEQGGK